MKRSRFSEQQIAFILHQAEEGVAVEGACRKAGISLQTYYRWRKKYGGLMPSEGLSPQHRVVEGAQRIAF
jgi:putative transposase